MYRRRIQGLLPVLACLGGCTIILEIPVPQDIDEDARGVDASSVPEVDGATVDARPPPRRADLLVASEDQAFVSFSIHRSAGDRFAPSAPWAVRDGGWSDRVHWGAGAFTRDDLDDVFAAWDDGGMNTLTVRRSIGESHVPEHWAQRRGVWSDSTQWVVGDFDGDGLADVAAVVVEASWLSIAVHRSTGTAFEPPRAWGSLQGRNLGSVRWAAGYFDRDHLADLVAIRDDNGSTSIDVLWSTGASFGETTWARQVHPWAATTRWLPGDVDGDGLSDLVAAWNDDDRVTVDVFRSTGTGLAPRERWSEPAGDWTDDARWASGDFDGDGRTDVASIWNDAGRTTLTVRRAADRTFTIESWTTRAGDWKESAVWLAGAFDPE